MGNLCSEKGTKAEEAVPEEQKERYKIWKTKTTNVFMNLFVIVVV